jgi:hypothetical protein
MIKKPVKLETQDNFDTNQSVFIGNNANQDNGKKIMI